MKIGSWGRYQSIEAEVLLPQTQSECARMLENSAALIPRGAGRSYGDSALNTTIIQSTYRKHYI
ncbi:MAG: FAD-binding oxidoreductase, partial [Polynucleobacter sp.]|nr:FAD-binding oxidoreductase [Polynucleobacter sp.]